MAYQIVTDSSCNLPEDVIESYQIEILPLHFIVEDKTYSSYNKGEVTDLQQFYTMMRAKKDITTSQISRLACEALFKRILREGKDILYIGFSSGLSGTYQAAHMVLVEMAARYPDRVILDVDTLGASLGEGLLVYHAAEQKAAGASIHEVHRWLMENRLHLCHWFTVDDLFFLMRGGRVSRTAATFGTMLNIKPVMHMDDEGHLIPLYKVRGRKRSLGELVRNMERLAIEPEKQAVFISHGDCIKDAEYVADRVERRMHPRKILINYVDPVIGAHSGPGTVALFFLGTER